MCEKCGCAGKHHHEHGQSDHVHDDEHHHHGATKTLTIEERILSRNDRAAHMNRHWLHERGVAAVNLVSSPGSGKTSLLEVTLGRLAGKVGCAVITGDQRTDNDARRLMGRGAEVAAIETHDACHLDAEQVGRLLPKVVREGTQLLFIENVGNLICPAAFDLGEQFMVALLSVTEGEDKPVKYPSVFSSAPVVILTKTDLLPHVDFKLATCREYLNRMRPGVAIFELSARNGNGMDAWIGWLESLAAGQLPSS